MFKYEDEMDMFLLNTIPYIKLEKKTLLSALSARYLSTILCLWRLIRNTIFV